MKVIEGKFGETKEKEGQPPNQNIVEKLELLLELAKAGEIQQLAFACNVDRAMHGYDALPDTDGYALVGMLQVAQLQILDYLQDNASEDVK